jgi:hypothetical protein
VLSFALGAGPVPALLLPEIFASRIRAKAVALSLGMHWVSHDCPSMHQYDIMEIYMYPNQQHFVFFIAVYLVFLFSFC